MSSNAPNNKPQAAPAKPAGKPAAQPKSRVTRTTLSYSLRSSLLRRDDGVDVNTYSTMECGLTMEIDVADGEQAHVRNMTTQGFVDLGAMIRKVLKTEAEKMGLIAVVAQDPAERPKADYTDPFENTEES